MIMLTRLSGSRFVLNSDLIERIDATPDTVISLTDGTKYVVSEAMPDVVAAVRDFRAEIVAISYLPPSHGPTPTPAATPRLAPVSSLPGSHEHVQHPESRER